MGSLNVLYLVIFATYVIVAYGQPLDGVSEGGMRKIVFRFHKYHSFHNFALNDICFQYMNSLINFSQQIENEKTSIWACPKGCPV